MAQEDTPHDDRRKDRSMTHTLHAKFEIAIIQKEPIPRSDIFMKPTVLNWNRISSGADQSSRKSYACSFFEWNAFLWYFSDADLRPLKILEEGDRFPNTFCCRSDVPNEREVMVVRSMREIQSCHIHPGAHHAHQYRNGFGSWTDGADDLRAFVAHEL